MRKPHLSLLTLTVALSMILLACGEPEVEVEPELQNPERFVWTDQPIVFVPPSAEWERHRWQEKGLQGVSFQIPRVPPGRILVAEYYLLYRGHSRTSVATGRTLEYEPALPGAKIEDVVDRVLFDPSGMPMRDSVTVSEMVEREVGGRRALALDYTWNDGQSQFTGREVYLMADDRLFVVTLLGIESDLELFERIVATIGFPEREAEEDSE